MTQATSNTLSHLTDEERRLLELAEKATERPWRVDDIYADAEADIHAADGFPVARTSSTCIKPWEHLGIRHWSEAPKVAFIEREEDEVAANAAYIVEACNSIPALLTTIDQLRGELERVKQERDEALKKLHGAEGMIAIASEQIEDLQAQINGMPMGTSASTLVQSTLSERRKNAGSHQNEQ